MPDLNRIVAAAAEVAAQQFERQMQVLRTISREGLDISAEELIHLLLIRKVAFEEIADGNVSLQNALTLAEDDYDARYGS